MNQAIIRKLIKGELSSVFMDYTHVMKDFKTGIQFALTSGVIEMNSLKEGDIITYKGELNVNGSYDVVITGILQSVCLN